MIIRPSSALSLLLLLIACAAPARKGGEVESSTTQVRSAQRIALPPAARTGRMSLEETLARRRSMREFSGKNLNEAQMGQLLWAAQGITHPEGLRTAPSAGALYPLEVYVATAAGFFHYVSKSHEMVRRSERDLRYALYQAALEQESVRDAPAVFVIAAVLERTARKYGEARSPRYVHLEAGHAAQNLLLQAVALQLGAVPIGAFQDAQVRKVLSLPGDEWPLYLIPVGYPR